jgi:hypothetical protein
MDVVHRWIDPSDNPREKHRILTSMRCSGRSDRDGMPGGAIVMGWDRVCLGCVRNDGCRRRRQACGWRRQAGVGRVGTLTRTLDDWAP